MASGHGRSGGSASSRAVAHAGSKNAQCKSALQHELQQLDKEKEHVLHNLRHEASKIQNQNQKNPASRPGTATATGSRSPRASPNPSRKASVCAGGDRSPRPSHRPDSSSSSSTSSSKVQRGDHVPVTEMAARHAANDVPQILVSDAAEGKRGGGGSGGGSKGQGSNTKRRGSVTKARSGPGSDSDSSVLSQSLSLPSFRGRSDSMPGPNLGRRASNTPTPAPDLKVPDIQRSRSNSFSSIQPARRRGSVVEQWGSISERNRPTMGSFKGRRGSVDMENLLRDLSFGVQHSELMKLDKLGGSSASDRQWEELKKCRYLRIPSRDNSQEDVNQD